MLPVTHVGAMASVSAPGTLPRCSKGWAMSITPPMPKTRAPAVMALTGLNMVWVLPMTVGVWPFVAGMGLGWYSVVSVVVGG